MISWGVKKSMSLKIKQDIRCKFETKTISTEQNLEPLQIPVDSDPDSDPDPWGWGGGLGGRGY